MSRRVKAHPTNPHGVLVPCAVCGRELHVPRDEQLDPAHLTCSYDCMTVLRRSAAIDILIRDGDPLQEAPPAA